MSGWWLVCVLLESYPFLLVNKSGFFSFFSVILACDISLSSSLFLFSDTEICSVALQHSSGSLLNALL